MPKSVTNDNLLTNPPPNRRNIDASDVRNGPPKAPATAGADRQVELSRAQQFLIQEAQRPRASAVSTLEQARALAGELRAQLAADPRVALQAYSQLNANVFEVATARPSA